ncbi:MAG: hypothetical protein C0620_00715 [Desulfuromonas sp.]|nr:MAG: hypothetical protein C0620_00715 [Desulfuromonas sp.]
MMKVRCSGYCAWINQQNSTRQKDDERLVGLIKQFWFESGCVYGYRKIHLDLREHGEICGPNRVARLMKLVGFKAQGGYKKPQFKGSKPAISADNPLNQELLDVAQNAWRSRSGCARDGGLAA